MPNVHVEASATRVSKKHFVGFPMPVSVASTAAIFSVVPMADTLASMPVAGIADDSPTVHSVISWRFTVLDSVDDAKEVHPIVDLVLAKHWIEDIKVVRVLMD